MRILMPCAAFPPFVDGGGPVSALVVATLLKNEGHDVRVVNASDEEKFETYQGIPVHRIKPLNLYWNYHLPRPSWKKACWHMLENGNPRAYSFMRREIQSFNPDIVLTDSIENINVATWAAAKSLGLPVAHTIRSAFLLCWKGVMQKSGHACDRQCGSCRLTAIGKLFFSRFVDLAIGESDDILQRHLKEGYFRNAVPQRIPGAIPDECAMMARSYPAGRPFRIGFIGAHTQFKGIDVLAEAVRLLPKEYPLEFYIAGTGRDAFAEEVRARFPARTTKFLGWIEPEIFFPQIDLLAFPSIGREAFGRVAVEAFSHAIPVIGSSLGGIAETIVPGINGLHVPPQDPLALKNALWQIASAPQMYEAFSRGALSSADDYRASRIGTAYTQALGAAVDRNKGPV
ncbi:glycosyltransferase [uncultured Roseibium sp.]|uniref:glycosyltransferase n=1 Tax=uncultured Roseibium sp. TaxID=1936171 RepID=UPI0026346ABD|nr:glycosyltransferase [uncultured Roseibium sp.]